MKRPISFAVPFPLALRHAVERKAQRKAQWAHWLELAHGISGRDAVVVIGLLSVILTLLLVGR